MRSLAGNQRCVDWLLGAKYALVVVTDVDTAGQRNCGGSGTCIYLPTDFFHARATLVRLEDGHAFAPVVFSGQSSNFQKDAGTVETGTPPLELALAQLTQRLPQAFPGAIAPPLWSKKP